MTDADGRVIAATNPATIGQDQSRASWFLAVTQSPGVHLTDAARFEETGGDTAVGFSLAIRDSTGRFLGAVSSRVTVGKLEDVFRKTVERLKARQEGPLRVEWQFLTGNGDLIADSLLREEWKDNLLRLGLPSAVRLQEAGEPGYLEERHARLGTDAITGHARTEGYLDFPGFHWGILVRVDRAEVLRPVRSLMWKLGIIAAILVVPLVTLLLWASVRLRREWLTSSYHGRPDRRPPGMAGRGDPAGRYVQLTVTDTGCGMDAETLAHLFEPFFTTKEQGTGLGLATVYGIVKQHGGVIMVQSEPSRGTGFRMAFPSARTPNRSKESRETVRGDRPGGTETILLVEDEPGVRRLVTAMLVQLGYLVLEAESGEAALALAAQAPAPIDLLVTDVIMPGMSGPKLARELIAHHPALKVLFLSGYPREELARYDFARSEVAFLPKPFTPEVLAEAVRDAIGSSW